MAHCIRIVYSPDRANEAEAAARLVEERFGAKPTTTAGFQICLEILRDVYDDAAIIFVSDQATACPQWQEHSRAIGQNERAVPIGGLSNDVDYNDTNLVPACIEEVNFIPLGENWQRELVDSLTTPRDFYEMKSQALLHLRTWVASGEDEGFLVTSLITALKQRRSMRKRLRQESDPVLSSQLKALDEFLTLSIRRGILNGYKDITTTISRFSWAFIAAVLIYGSIALSPYLKRASIASSLYSVDTTGSLPDTVAAVRLEEARSNSLVPEAAAERFAGDLNSVLNRNWQNCPIGAYYRWYLNDIALTSSKDYVWAATSEGCAIRWNTHNGAIDHKEQVGQDSLTAIASADDESRLAALDSAGNVFSRSADGMWRCICESTPINDDGFARLYASPSWDHLVAHNYDTICFIGLGNDQANVSNAITYQHVLCANVLDGGIGYALVESSGQLLWLTIENGSVSSETKVPTLANATCTADILGCRALFATEDGSVFILDPNSPELITYAGISLSRPVSLAFVNDSTIVYHDRNAGTRLFSLEFGADLGSCIAYPSTGGELKAYDGMVALNGLTNVWYTEDVNSLIPLTPGDVPPTAPIHEGTSGTTENGLLRSAEVVGDVLVKLSFDPAVTETIVVIDGTHRLEGGKAQDATALRALLPEDYGVFYFAHTPFTGTVTLVSILDGGTTLLFGTSDGHIFDLKADTDATVELRTSFQIPTHAAITCVYEDGDRYLARDVAGNVWQVRAGCASDINDQVKEKLHNTCYAFYDELFDIVDPRIHELYGMERIPGSNMEEWG